ncbi:MAG: hypothetical protein IM536_16315 [Pseudanabaena sp. M34BS1SP1A06MG]|nr:hypothetical protein [Pseudanabaena sp. M53BS1SP1A06MG]MCA6583553.1 hypothetical protein [Pseudanabaena sp. M34BS1SP1A06MG]
MTISSNRLRLNIFLNVTTNVATFKKMFNLNHQSDRPIIHPKRDRLYEIDY